MEIVRENYIYKINNIIEDSVCDKILDYYQRENSNDINGDELPWFENNTLYWNVLRDTEIGKDIGLCRDKIIDFAEECYNETLYPNVSTLVMWKEGKDMPIHKDNGYEDDKEQFHMRKYSAVLYLNDDYDGGETIILKENSDEVEIKNNPKKGSVIIFRSDESCLHGVKTVTRGNRLTFGMWFTEDIEYQEA